MKELETSKHLFQRPLYKSSSGGWACDFNDALRGCEDTVHLDIAAVASILSFSMAGEERTLLKEIKRRPWLSEVNDAGEVRKEVVPPHGFMTGTDDQVAKRFYKLLCDEARTACQGYKEIYVLLSGGLDSRIVAGVLSNLYQAGEILAKPIAVTWGLADSRDVVYAEQMARILGFEWQHIPITPETVLENIDATARQLGALHSPELLHNMLWFKNIPSTALVLAGSFGDSIGRAEFGGIHLLGLGMKTPVNNYNLMRSGAFREACIGVNEDLNSIHSRGGNVPLYAKNEHWMQGYRMRGGLCHALTIINSYANIYQMFTAPAVYEFIWSLHPVRRDDEIYATILENEFPKLARVPWARTNRAFRGATIGAGKNLRADYHEYIKWSSGPLFSEVSNRIDPDWFEAMRIFNPESIQNVKKLVKMTQNRVGQLNLFWLWLAGFRTFVEHLEDCGKTVVVQMEGLNDIPEEAPKRSLPSALKKYGVCIASKSSVLNSTLKSVRRCKRRIDLNCIKNKVLRENPPIAM